LVAYIDPSQTPSRASRVSLEPTRDEPTVLRSLSNQNAYLLKG
jgi:hypothetical protein